MLVQEAPINVERNGEFQKSQFRIKASAKAFKILSSNLYSDKIGSILRELGTNAADSHKEAKQNKPFEVTLPTRFSQDFKIRDYGTGLSKEDIETLYTTYFESTRNSSNDYTGALGLGSKSPFCYVDQFTVTSFFNGKRHIYNALIGEEGFPQIELMQEGETTEPNGLMISFPTKLNDNYEFQTKAKNIYQYFKIKPVVKGAEVKFDDIKYELEEPDWAGWKGGNSIKGVMGNIAYPIDTYQSKITNYNFIQYYSFILQFDIGELDITASRESLEYTEKTIKNIQDKFKKIDKIFVEKIKKELDNQSCFWDALIFAKNNSLFLGSSNLEYKGKKIKTYPGTIETPKDWTINVYQMGYGCKLRGRKDNLRYVAPEHNIKFVYNDLEKGAQLRLSNFLKEEYAKGHKDKYYLVKCPTRQDLVDEFGITDNYVVLASSLPKISRTYIKGNLIQSYRYCHTNCANVSGSPLFWTKEDVDINGDGVYVEMDGWTSVGFDNFNMYETQRDLQKLGYTVDYVYGIRKRLAKKLGNKWVLLKDLWEKAKKKLETHRDLAMIKQDACRFFQYIPLLSKVQDKELIEFLTKIKEIKQQSDVLDQTIRLLNITDHTKMKEVASFEKKYPFLEYFWNNQYLTIDNKLINLLADYINNRKGN